MSKLRWVGCAAVLGIGGCFYPADRGRALEMKVDKLSADNSELSSSLKASQERLAATFPKIDEKIAELDRASRHSGADIAVQLQKTVEEVAQLRGQVETYLYKINELESGLKKLTDETEQKFSDQSAPAKAAADAKRRADELQRPSDAKHFLALAEDKAKAGDQALARQLYAEFLKKWPKDEGVAQAHFGLGESFYAEDKCPEALYEYGQVATKYPKSKIAPEALLHSSDCFRKTKDLDNARAALEEILSSYPRSEAAKSARAKLVELDKSKRSGSNKKARK